MLTRRLTFGEDAIAAAANLILAGNVVAIPTETVYGLAGDATSDVAVAAIYAAKGRPSFNPLIVHVANADAAFAIGEFDAITRALAAEHWPGPLTIVVPLRPDNGIASLTTAGLMTIALRVPAHRAMQALLAATGKPLAAPSANASGTISPTRASHVLRSLDGRIPLVIDDGPTVGGLESTIVAIKDGLVRVLRPGPISFASPDQARIDEIPQAPGQLAAHYAPSKSLRIDASTAEPDEWHIGFGAIAGNATFSATGDMIEAAARLFDLLHAADAGAALRIAVAPVPESGLGIAINDRLRRAATGAPKP